MTGHPKTSRRKHKKWIDGLTREDRIAELAVAIRNTVRIKTFAPTCDPYKNGRRSDCND